MIDLSDFSRPGQHAFGLLQGETHAAEKEAFLCWCLNQCFAQGDLRATFVTSSNEDGFAADGYLVKKAEKLYSLSERSIGLLYSIYGKRS